MRSLIESRGASVEADRHSVTGFTPKDWLLLSWIQVRKHRAMAGEFEFSFPPKQIEALIRALEQCGVNRGSYQPMLEHFRDPELINAAKAAYAVLRRKEQKQATVIAELRDKLVRERQEHAEVLSQAADLLSTLYRVQGILRRKLNVQADDPDHTAIAKLDEAVDRLRWGLSHLAARLDAIQSERGGK